MVVDPQWPDEQLTVTLKRAPLLFWRFAWPALVMAALVAFCLALARASNLLFFTSIIWAPIVLLVAAFLLCVQRWERVPSIIVAGCVVWKCFPAFRFAAVFTDVCADAPSLAVSIASSGKPTGQRLLVLRDWSRGFAGSPFNFLVYDDTGVLRASTGAPAPFEIPGSFKAFSDTNAQLCIGRSQHIVWRFYICTI
jgi:hypothetical protein